MIAHGATARWLRGLGMLAGFSLLLAVAGRLLYALPVNHTLQFLIFLFAGFYLPGAVVAQRLVSFREWAVGHSILALGLGLSLVSVAYQILRACDMPFAVLPVALAVAAAAWLLDRWRDRFESQDRRANGLSELAGLAFLLVGTLVALHFSHFGDLSVSENALAIRTVHLSETVFHLGLVNSLADAYPPPALYAAGGADFAHYHLGMHLQMDLAARLTGIPTWELAFDYFPLLYFVLLAALPFVFVRSLGGSTVLAAGCGLLMFASNFSYLAVVLTQTRSEVWAALLPQTIWSTFTLNGILPAATSLGIGIVTLHRYLNSQGRWHLPIIGLCVVTAYTLKTSFGVHLAAALFGAGVLALVSDRGDRKAAGLALLGGLTLGGLLLVGFVSGTAADTISIRLAPFDMLQRSLGALGLHGTDVIWWPVLWLLVLLGSLGVRVVGVAFLYDVLVRRGAFSLLALFLGIFIASGYLVSELLFIGRGDGLNNASWFFVQALMAAWFATFWALVKVRWPVSRHWVLAGMFVLSAPVTMQFLAHRATNEYAEYGPDALAVVQFLRTTDPQSTVLHPLNLDRPSLAANLAGRSSVLSPYLSFVMSDDGLAERGSDVLTFFHEETKHETRNEILAKYGVDYVYVPRAGAENLRSLPALRLELQNEGYSVFRVEKGAHR